MTDQHIKKSRLDASHTCFLAVCSNAMCWALHQPFTCAISFFDFAIIQKVDVIFFILQNEETKAQKG